MQSVLPQSFAFSAVGRPFDESAMIPVNVQQDTGMLAWAMSWMEAWFPDALLRPSEVVGWRSKKKCMGLRRESAGDASR